MSFWRQAASIAREAGELLREYYKRGVRAEYKGDVDLVTEADRASETLIVERLKSAFSYAWDSMAKRARGRGWMRSSGGMLTRWMERRTLRMGFPAFLRGAGLRAAGGWAEGGRRWRDGRGRGV